MGRSVSYITNAEEKVFFDHMSILFAAGTEYVIIYSSNDDLVLEGQNPHVKHRMFSKWIEKNTPSWKLVKEIENQYPFAGNYTEGTLSDFYIYQNFSLNRP